MFSAKSRTPSGRDAREVSRRHHRQMLLVAAIVVALSFLLEVREDQRVNLLGSPNYPAPETCLSRSLYGVKCPGCGLTRSFIHLARGDWRASVAINRVGWVLALTVLIQFPYRLFCLKGGPPSRGRLLLARWFSYFLLVIILGNWVVEVVVYGL